MRPSAHGIFPSTTKSSMEIQRAGPDPDQQFARPWLGMIFLDQFEIFQASRRSQPNQLHEFPLLAETVETRLVPAHRTGRVRQVWRDSFGPARNGKFPLRA